MRATIAADSGCDRAHPAGAKGEVPPSRSADAPLTSVGNPSSLQRDRLTQGGPGKDTSSATMRGVLMAHVLKWLFSPWSADAGPPDPFWEAVKVVHADNLRRWTRFPEYRDHASTTYRAYREEARRVAGLRHEIREILSTIEELERLDQEGLEEYETTPVPVPRSLRRRAVTVPLPRPKHPGTVVHSRDGVATGEETSETAVATSLAICT